MKNAVGIKLFANTSQTLYKLLPNAFKRFTNLKKHFKLFPNPLQMLCKRFETPCKHRLRAFETPFGPN